MRESSIEKIKINEETLPLISSMGDMQPGGFFIYHAFDSQQLIYFNQRMVKLFGCESEEEFCLLTGNSFRGVVHPEDYEKMESSIRRQIDDSEDRIDHVQYRFVRKDGSVGMLDDYGYFTHSETWGDIFTVFVQDISEQYYENLERNRLLKQQREDLITMLTGSESTYIICPATEKYTILGRNSYLQNNYAPDESFTDAVTRYIETDVFPLDREDARDQISLKRMSEVLTSGEKRSFRFRDISGGVPRYYEMNAVRLSETEVLCSFNDIDDALTQNIIYQKFQENYFGLYYVSLETGFTKIIRTAHPELTGEVGSFGQYRNIIHSIASSSKAETSAFLERIGKIEYLKERFQNEDIAYYYYPSYIFEGTRWVSATGRVLKRSEDGVPTLFGLGFSLMDENASESETIKARAIRDDMENLLESISASYDMVYLINLAEDSLVVRKMNDNMLEFGQHFQSFSSAKNYYLSNVVHPRDREKMRLELSNPRIRSRLSETSSYTVDYTVLKNHATLWGEMSVLQASGEHIIIGMAEHDLEISKRKLADKRFEEYLALYMVDLDEETIRPVRTSRLYHSLEKGRVGSYKEAIQKFAALYSDETRDFFLKISDTGILKSIFEKNDKFTYSFKTVLQSEYKWIDMVCYCLIRHEDGSPALLSMGYTVADDIASQIHDVQDRLKTDMQMIGGLAGEYYALFYYRIHDQKFSIYTLDKKRFPLAADIVSKGGDAIELLKEFGGTELIHPEDRVLFAEISSEMLLEKLLHSKKYSLRFRRITDGGDYRWVEINFIKYEEKDTPANALAIGFSDVSEEVARKQAEDTEKENQRRKLEKALLRNDLIHRSVRASQWSFKIGNAGEVISSKYDDFSDARTDSITFPDPMQWLDYVHPEDRTTTAEKFLAAVRDTSGETPWESTFRLLNNDGSYRWNKASGRVYPLEDGTSELLGINVDIHDQITEQEQHQKQLSEALTMAESANRAKTTFLNNMSHDIRTPMNAIIGYTGLAASHIENRTQVLDYLGKIGQSSNHLLSLINDVLDMSRIESGKMNLEEKPENLPEIVHTLRNIVQADIRARQHDFYIDTVNIQHEYIICDKLRLNQVLLNILSNSIKYTSPGGMLSMRISELTVKPNGYAVFEFRVKDNGMGMDLEFLKSIYEPFTRVKSTTISGIQGTGLGMAITKNIIDMMGGKIAIQSEPGKGTETTVTFDFKLQEEQHIPTQIPELMGLRALVVDDDANTCVSIEAMLSEIGMNCEWCTSGREAVFRAENAYRRGNLFRVYVLDWLLPDMNGIETARRIRRVIGDDTPIIVLTAYDWSDIEEEAREAGVTAFVSKPMFPSDLGRVLCSCLGWGNIDEAEKRTEFNFNGKKILLVEDNELNREIAQELLEEEGILVDTAEDGSFAVEKAKAAVSGTYDLILMDIQMPVMDGYEAARRIRALDNEFSDIPIIAMTANAFEEDRISALEAGMNEHVAKPIDIGKLKSVLAKFL